MSDEGIYTRAKYAQLKKELEARGYSRYTNPLDAQTQPDEECPYCNAPIGFHQGFKKKFSYRCFAVCSDCGAAFEF